jgi:hypothetical protein
MIGSIRTPCIPSVKRHEHSIDDMAHFRTPQSCDIAVLKISLDPLYLFFVDAVPQAIVDNGIRWCYNLWGGSHFQRFDASSTSQRIAADNQMHMVAGIHRSQQ